jgi:methionyl-tRNA formyltransferase/L-amino acid N-acyltransferase YncA
MVNSILLFGDPLGIPQLLKALPLERIVGLVGAEVRPQQYGELKEIAQKHGVSLLIQPRHTSPDYPKFVQRVCALDPDLILVNSYSMLIRPEILAIPRFGALNIHGALLPQYRGCNPTQWALLNDETETGVTMHYMDAHFDTGDIIAQRRVPIHFEDTWRDIQARSMVATEAMLAEELPKLLKGTNSRQPQDESKAHYWPRRHPEDGRIDWGQNVLYIYNLIRALVKPHPGAFYLDAIGQQVMLDEYLSIPQVTAHKYGRAGGQMLKAQYIALTPLAVDDLPTMLAWINERDQVLFNAPYKPVLENQHKEWFEAIQRRNDVAIFGIRLRKTNALIGTCQLHSINYVHRTAELQIRSGNVAQRGHGYNKEATHLLLDFAFKDLNLRRVYLHVFSSNITAIRTYEKAGFIEEGVLRKAAHIDGQYVDVNIMGILREDYASA